MNFLKSLTPLNQLLTRSLTLLLCVSASSVAWAVPQVTITPPSIFSFGTQTISSVTSQTFTVSLNSAAAVIITGISAPPSGFAITGGSCTVGYTLGAPCTLVVSFTPTAAITYFGSLTVSTSLVAGPVGTPVPVQITGTGVAPPTPAITVTPSTLAFPTVVAGLQSGVLSYTVRNSGAVNVTVSNVNLALNIAGAFVPWPGTCIGTVLAPGQTCVQAYRFAPSTPGTYSGTASFFLAGVPTLAAQASLTGFSTAPSLLPPTAVIASGGFPPTTVGTTSAPVVINIQNPNTQAITLTGYTVDPAFTVVSTTCTASLAASQTCTYTVTFKPTVAGTVNTPFTVNTSAGAASAPLSATGVALVTPSGTVTLSPTTANFGSVTVGSQSTVRPFTVQNSTTSAVSPLQVSVSAGFTQSSNCGSTLAAGASCTINVQFTPLAAGTASGSLNVTAPASATNPAVALSAALTGTGTAVTPVVTPTGSVISAIPRAIAASITATTSQFITYSFSNGIPRVVAADGIFCTTLIGTVPATGATATYPCAANSEFARHPTTATTFQTVQQSGSVVRATETIRIPSSVTRTAQNLGAATFYFVRRFDPQGFAVVEIRATGAIMNAPIALNDVRLAFDTSQGPQPLVFVARDAALPPVTATLFYTGSGMLRGRWELVLPGDVAPTERDLLPEASLPRSERGTQRRYQLLRRFEQLLPGNGRVELKLPSLSQTLGVTAFDGQYQLLLRIEAEPSIYGGESGAANFAMPLLRYFVGSITAPAARLAPITAQLSFNGARPTFSWAAIAQARYYRVEVADRNNTVIYSAIVRDNERSYSALAGFTAASGSQWRVQSLDAALQPTGESPWRAL